MYFCYERIQQWSLDDFIEVFSPVEVFDYSDDLLCYLLIDVSITVMVFYLSEESDYLVPYAFSVKLIEVSFVFVGVFISYFEVVCLPPWGGYVDIALSA